jgi:hypothetical protein
MVRSSKAGKEPSWSGEEHLVSGEKWSVASLQRSSVSPSSAPVGRNWFRVDR